MDNYNLDGHKVPLTPLNHPGTGQKDRSSSVPKKPQRLNSTSSEGLSAALKFKNPVTSEDPGWSQVSHFTEASGIPDNNDHAKSKSMIG